MSSPSVHVSLMGQRTLSLNEFTREAVLNSFVAHIVLQNPVVIYIHLSSVNSEYLISLKDSVKYISHLHCLKFTKIQFEEKSHCGCVIHCNFIQITVVNKLP